MILYKDIPGKLSDFVVDRDFTSMLSDLNPGHDWRFVDTDYFLTDYAKKWFSDRDIVLKPKSALFKADPNATHLIHADSFVNDVGFNYVLAGTGDMQWVNPIGAAVSMFHEKGVEYPMYNDSANIEIIDKWTGSMGMVNIKVPHRIVTTGLTSPRICLSLRPNFAICNVNFDMLYDRI